MIAVIFNGIRLPYHVVHYTISKAKENSAAVFALFLKGKHEPSKGYIFPSDITLSETEANSQGAVSSDEQLISDNMELVKEMIENEKISYHTSLKTNASIAEVAETVAAADLVIIDENFDNPTLLSDNKISLNMLRKKIRQPVELVSEKTD